MKSIKKLFVQVILLSGILFSSVYATANESGVVQGCVIDKKNHPVEYATASLKNLETLKTEDGAMCDKSGNFVIENVKPGNYALSISMIGYKKCDVRNIIIDENKKIVEETFVMKDSIQHLHALVVTAKCKPLTSTKQNNFATSANNTSALNSYISKNYNNFVKSDWKQYFDLSSSIRPLLSISKFIISYSH